MNMDAQKIEPGDILIIDDTPANLHLLADILSEDGHSVRPVLSGKQGLTAAARKPPDLVLLDIKMPGMDGFEVCARLKEDPNLKEIPILFISALGDTSDKVRAFNAGGVDYITKPLQMEEVRARVRTHLNLRRSFIQLREIQLQLIQSEKMAALGELMVNLSHQWRQPLSALSLLIQDMDDAYDYGEMNREYFKDGMGKGLELINRMSSIINGFSDFFRPKHGKELFRISDKITEVISIVEEGLLQYSIRCDVDIRKDNELYGYAQEFGQVIMHIITNAQQVLVEKKTTDRQISIIVDQNESDRTVIMISDNGPGIPAEIFDRIFEPYFAVGYKSEGRGMGLFIAKMIIERHMNGSLSAENTDNGALFTIVV